MVETLTFQQLADKYCERQENTPKGVRQALDIQQREFRPEGWMLLECQVMDSSRLGELVIVPYGPNNTFMSPPSTPVSPRGLASDISVVVGVMPAAALDEVF